ncbi:hypothetical protein ALC57_13320 [Trachymyrmex cornetzi]|uniref:Uncharacterized protein n=1 Tax=Trachymyrmex cornetzi TaxID=471704 RepID=A0A151IZF9_9HYME|nr:hypothetical protein ALC57_13320 [Trachymyrmex cornetzi]
MINTLLNNGYPLDFLFNIINNRIKSLSHNNKLKQTNHKDLIDNNIKIYCTLPYVTVTKHIRQRNGVIMNLVRDVVLALILLNLHTSTRLRIARDLNIDHTKVHKIIKNKDAREIVLGQVRDAVERHGSVKVNTAFNGEFATKDKRAIKSINTKNIEIYRYTDLHACTTSERVKNWSCTQGFSCGKWSPTKKVRHRTHTNSMRYVVWATTCVAHTTTRCRIIVFVAATIASHGSPRNSEV